MRDGLGAVQNVLLFGGTSDIGLAIVRRLAQEHRLQRIVLAARDVETAQRKAVDLQADVPNATVTVAHFDSDVDPAGQVAIEGAFAGDEIDCAILAVGLLGSDLDSLHDIEGVNSLIQANYLSAVLTGTAVIDRFQEQGFGTLVVLSSVAAERPRADNFLYASTKAGIDAWACGLADALADKPIDVIVVRPGFVHSKMTAGLRPQPLATTPDEVAEVTVEAIRKRTPLVWAPKTVRPLMSVLRHLPRPAFRAVTKRAAR